MRLAKTHTGCICSGILRSALVVAAFTTLWHEGSGQKVVHDGQLWVAYFNQVRLHDRWAVWTDVHLRAQDHFIGELTTMIIRPAITWYAQERLRFTAGYVYARHYNRMGPGTVTQPEHRPWQQAQLALMGRRLRCTQSVRMEQRWRRNFVNRDTLADTYGFNHRARYNLLLQTPLSSKGFVPGTLAAVLNNEVHVNFSRSISGVQFDQNRFFLGLHYQIDPALGVQFGYMNLYRRPEPEGRMDHTVRMFVQHVIDLRKED